MNFYQKKSSLKSLLAIPLILSPVAFWAGCGDNGGSGDSASYTTETENAIAVRVFDGATPAARTSFKVMPNWFLADTSKAASESEYTYSGTTDENGWVRIENHPEGSFTLQLVKGDSAVVTQYNLNKLSPVFTNDSIALNARGSVDGWVALPQNAKYAWVFVKGVDMVQKTDSTGHFAINDVPSGSVDILAWVPQDQTVAGVASIKVEPADTLFLETLKTPDEMEELQDPWRYSRSIAPSKLISDWMKPITLPMVVTIRLDATTFDFATAKNDGSDLRLYDAEGELLPIEIDTWSTTVQSGIVNVRIEKPADTAGTWTLKWGNPTARTFENADVWAGMSDSVMQELNSAFIIGFENDSQKNDLQPPLIPNSWYLGTKVTENLDSIQLHNNMKAIEDADEGRNGKALHIKYSANWPEYVLMGTRISKASRDIGHLDSIEVWIRGNGKYNIILEDLVSDYNHKVEYIGDAKEEWERVVVRPQDFKSDTISYHGWEQTRHNVTHFTVFAFDGTDLWIDDVRLYGINRDDLR